MNDNTHRIVSESRTTVSAPPDELLEESPRQVCAKHNQPMTDDGRCFWCEAEEIKRLRAQAPAVSPDRFWTHAEMREFIDEAEKHLSGGRTHSAAMMFHRAFEAAPAVSTLLEKLAKSAESYVSLSRTRGFDLRPEAADDIRNVLAEVRAALQPPAGEQEKPR